MVFVNGKSLTSTSGSTASQSTFFAPRSKTPNRQAIALISDHGDPAAEIGKEEAGGQNVYVRQVGEALSKLGWQVDMFTRKAKADDPTIVQHNPHCRTIRLSAGPEEFVPRDRLFEYMPQFVEEFHKYQAKHHYPLIHTNYWMSAWVGLEVQKTHNVQLINTYHSLGAVKYQAVPHRPAIAETRLAVEKAILENAHCTVATSPQEADMLRSLVSDLGHIEVIPCGTDISRFYAIPKVDARLQLGLKPTDEVIVYVGRFDPRKGIETLVRAAQLIKRNTVDASNLRLVIVGGSDPTKPDGQERQRIEQLVGELGLAEHTTFAGRVGHDRLPLYYTAADVCVIPSHYEPFGLVAIEAMACGTPVVASDVGGLKFSVVPEETGLLVPPQDETAFAAAIERILSDELWARKLRKRASERVQQNFSWTGVAAQLSDLYRRMLAQSIMGDMILPSQSAISVSLNPDALPNPSRKPALTKSLTKVS
ncbi:glycosyltransferase family 4 protein [Myxacorys almedinensis]|uniref:Glycosyltransferase n=1 Tax=Myxacorys almedinensis A TaxID=2690445 RepID=A0A8J8CIC8_9CYAN|nr:glycosyltransferase family 1 protein [Myxacorys almedinensis]NDJ17613.1 glycosyltransferase [Myxacorys almedinensis A]